MTTVRVWRINGHVRGLLVSGHAESVPSGEADIICAAVSVLVQALHIGLVDVLGVPVRSEVEKKRASIEMHWDGSDPLADAVAETIVASLKETARSYPENVKLTEVS